MSDVTTVERGRFGRLAVMRLRPNADLTEAVEAACAEQGLTHGQIRSCVGSLTDAVLTHGAADDGAQTRVTGPGLEIALLGGEVRPDANGQPRAVLRGLVADAEGRAVGGRFLRGANPICITVELVIQEWLPEQS